MTTKSTFSVSAFMAAHAEESTYLGAVRLWASNSPHIVELKKSNREAYDQLYAWCREDLAQKIVEPC